MAVSGQDLMAADNVAAVFDRDCAAPSGSRGAWGRPPAEPVFVDDLTEPTTKRDHPVMDGSYGASRSGGPRCRRVDPRPPSWVPNDGLCEYVHWAGAWHWEGDLILGLNKSAIGSWSSEPPDSHALTAATDGQARHSAVSERRAATLVTAPKPL
jgi:hypothetical protein